jgi:hypothetical protein
MTSKWFETVAVAQKRAKSLFTKGLERPWRL